MLGSDLISWINERKEAAQLKVASISLGNTDQWNLNEFEIEHDTKRFFSIVGIKAMMKNSTRLLGCQPIIYQPEIGILGFVVRQFEGRVEILLQAKTEPGNIGGTQIAPSVQATHSNYMQVHQGEPTKYLEYFLKDGELVKEGTLQSEQGTRFWGKYNRNVTVVLSSETCLEVDDRNWEWVDIKDLFEVIDCDFLINTDARSVLICSEWEDLVSGQPFQPDQDTSGFGTKLYSSLNARDQDSMYATDTLQKRLATSRAQNELVVEQCALNELSGWKITQNSIAKDEAFSVESFQVSVNGREVPEWCQPLVHSYKEGLVILYCQEKNGVLHFLVSHSVEIGFKEYVQFGPTVQVLEGGDDENGFDFQEDQVQVVIRCKQSDEGGRFYQSVVEYSIQEINPDVDVPFDGDIYSWMTLGQIRDLLPVQGNFTNEFRSALSLILKYI